MTDAPDRFLFDGIPRRYEWRPYSPNGPERLFYRRRPPVDMPIRFTHRSVASLAASVNKDHARILIEPGVYVLTLLGSERIKIGFTTSLCDRVHTLETGSPFPLTVLAFMLGDFALEQRLHARFAAHRVHREWFRDLPEVRASLAGELRERRGISILDQRHTEQEDPAS